MLLLLILLLLQAETPTPAAAQFWVMVGSVVSLLILQAFGMIQRSFQRRWDKEDRDKDKKEEKEERRAADEKAHKERQEIAQKVRTELELHYANAALDREKRACSVIDKIDEAEEVVKNLDEKIVTKDVAAEHKEELKEKIVDGAEKAKQAYEIANTINDKLSEMSKAGYLNKAQEDGRKDIDEIELKADKDK